MRFGWDLAKAAANARRHKVTFKAAKSVFYDDFAVQCFDDKHASVEDRFVLLGMSSDSRLLSVCQFERDNGDVVRIISARKATEREQRFIEVFSVKAEYDFSKMKSRRDPYASQLEKPVTMRLSEDVVEYFKGMASEAGVPYRSLINLYLRDCLAQERPGEIEWPNAA